ncbi:MAG: ABC transporter ATP-binding protein [Dehalococcoidia bacterium]
MLEVVNIDTYYGDAQALKGVSFNVANSELVTILGANGMGKTTLLKTITGLLKPKAGTIKFYEINIERMSTYDIVAAGVSLAPEGRGLFAEMSVLKNLLLGAYVHRDDKLGNKEMMDNVFELFPILKERQHQAAGTLSGGEAQMLAIGRALMARPKLLMLDEPSVGLAPQIVAHIFNIIKDLNNRGMTIVVAEQNAAMALSIAHRGYVLETGEVSITGEAKALLNDDRVKRVYIGA